MSKLLEQELEKLIEATKGGGFGDPEAREQHQREIDLIKFKITRRDNMKIAITSALIGAVVGAAITLLTQSI